MFCYLVSASLDKDVAVCNPVLFTTYVLRYLSTFMGYTRPFYGRKEKCSKTPCYQYHAKLVFFFQIELISVNDLFIIAVLNKIMQQ